MPYRSGYSVLPRLQKLNQPAFERDENYEFFIGEKEKETRRRNCFLRGDISDEALNTITAFIKQQATWVTATSFEDTAMQLQEDIAIHSVRNGRDFLAACHICFPSGWRPESKIGRPLREIHAPIPGMNLHASFALAETMVHRGPFIRYVWSPAFHPTRINYHPDLPRPTFDIDNPQLFVKIETQTTHGFPELGAALFTMRQQVIPQEQIEYAALFESMAAMTADEKKYKGVTDQLLQWCESMKGTHEPK